MSHETIEIRLPVDMSCEVPLPSDRYELTTLNHQNRVALARLLAGMQRDQVCCRNFQGNPQAVNSVNTLIKYILDQITSDEES